MKTSTPPRTISERFRMISLTAFLILISMLKAQTVLVPYSGSLSVPCGSNVVLQDHAGNSNYSNNADGYVVLEAGAAAAINIAGSYDVENFWDYVRIYDGVGTGGTLLQSFTGTSNLNFQGAAGQTLTVRFQSDGSVTYSGFNLNVTYSGACNTVACNGAPASNTVVGPSILICPNAGPNSLTLTNQYINGGSPATAVAMTGLTYAWYSGTVSPVGPFPNLIAGATSNTYAAPGATTSTWYQAVITCTNGALTTSATAGGVLIAGTTTSVVPYYESFEGIGYANLFPNCSWYSASLGTAIQTYINSNSNNRVPRTGNNFAAFAAPANSVTMWSNGIQLEPGVTYSAALHYATEYTGANNWTNLKMLIGPNQNNTGITQIASTSPAISGNYKLLSNVFTVPSSGLYYLAINASGVSGSAPYLMIDDISITIPCDDINGNSPTVTATSANGSYCDNSTISANATGADTYTWSTGENGAVSTPTNFNIGYNVLTVMGTNTLTGCVGSASMAINVLQSPPLFLFANNPVVCAGQAVNISASSPGNNNIVWSTTGVGNFITVTPVTNTTYSATVTGTNGCVKTESIQIVTMPLPTVSVSGGLPDMCAGEQIMLTGGGAASYTWNWNLFMSFQTILTDNPTSSTVYTLTGVGANGCMNKTTYTQNVSPCVSLTEIGKGKSINVYPNPSTGLFSIETGNGYNVLSVTDLSGRVIYTAQAGTGILSVDLSAFANGIYQLHVNTNEGNYNLKLVKQ